MWRSPHLEDLFSLHATYRGQRFPRHTHEEFVIGVNEKGTHRFFCRGRVHLVPPGTIALINPGDVHTGERADGSEWDYRGFYPTPPFLERLCEQELTCATSIAFSSPVVYDPPLAAKFLEAGRLIETGEGALAEESAVIEALTGLLTRHCIRRSGRAAVSKAPVHARRALEYIRQHALDPISLANLSAVTGLAPSSLVRAFRREYGMAPYEYVVTLRVAHARLLLDRGVPPVRAALACGFNDQSHLNRHFSKLMGVSPGAYARATSAAPARQRGQRRQGVDTV